MIRKLGACLTAFVVAVTFSPVTADAASSDANQNKINKYWNQLKKLPNRAAPVGKVNSLTKKLFKLETKASKLNKYFKTATKKYPLNVAKNKSASLQTQCFKIASNSGNFTDKELKKLNKDLTKDVKQVPTPTPYHASVETLIPRYV